MLVRWAQARVAQTRRVRARWVLAQADSRSAMATRSARPGRSTSRDRLCYARGCANVAIHAETQRHLASRWHTIRGGSAELRRCKDEFGRVFACASGDAELAAPCRGRPGHATGAAEAGCGTGSIAWSCGGWARARRSQHRSSIPLLLRHPMYRRPLRHHHAACTSRLRRGHKARYACRGT